MSPALQFPRGQPKPHRRCLRVRRRWAAIAHGAPHRRQNSDFTFRRLSPRERPLRNTRQHQGRHPGHLETRHRPAGRSHHNSQWLHHRKWDRGVGCRRRLPPRLRRFHTVPPRRIQPDSDRVQPRAGLRNSHARAGFGQRHQGRHEPDHCSARESPRRTAAHHRRVRTPDRRPLSLRTR